MIDTRRDETQFIVARMAGSSLDVNTIEVPVFIGICRSSRMGRI